MSRVLVIVVSAVLLVVVGVVVGRLSKDSSRSNDADGKPMAVGRAGKTNRTNAAVRVSGKVPKKSDGVALEDDGPKTFNDGTSSGVETAAGGGDSMIVNSLAVRDRIVETRNKINELFNEYDKAGGGDAAEAKLVNALLEMPPPALLGALQDMIRSGDVKAKGNALAALNAVYSDPSSPRAKARNEASPVSSGDAKAGDGEALRENANDPAKNEPAKEVSAQMEQDAEEMAMETKMIVDVVAAGLADKDESVRNASLDTVVALRGDESCILASQLLNGNDAALKRSLLQAVADATDERNTRINLQAFGGEDAAAKALAAENLEKSFGQSFKNVEEAEKWLSENREQPSAKGVGN